MLRTFPLGLIVLAVFGCGGPAAGSQPAAERTETAPKGSFSITFPSSWRTVPTSSGGYDQLALFADDPFDISIVVSSRPLHDVERPLDRRQLLDRMIELTMIHTVELGNEIIHVGQIDPLIDDWPAFAVVATSRDQSKVMTISRTFDSERTYVVTTLTDNQQGSPELGATVTRVVGSLAVHPAAPAPPR